MRPTDFLDALQRHQGRLVDKWSSYPEVYERHLARFRDRPLKLLEVGVFHGGSLQLWRSYLGPEAQIVGVDIDPRCQAYAEPGVIVETADQSRADSLAPVLARHGPFDVIIDDGSHLSAHQTLTLALAWPQLNDGGVYIVEDTHCAYWPSYGGGLRARNSFIEHCKDKVDDLHGYWSRDPASLPVGDYTRELAGLHFYDSIVVMEKRRRDAMPQRLVAGQPSRPLNEAETAHFALARQNLAQLKPLP